MTFYGAALTDLTSHCYQQGNDALEKREALEASHWYAQGLGVMRQLDRQNRDLMARTLLGLGKSFAFLDQPRSAIICCEASTLLLRRRRGEYEADQIFTAATIIAILEDLTAARRLYQNAMDRYRMLGQVRKVSIVKEKLRGILDQIGEKRYRALIQDTAPIESHDFLVYINGVSFHQLTITHEGQVEWKDIVDEDAPASIGLIKQWEVRCPTQSQ